MRKLVSLVLCLLIQSGCFGLSVLAIGNRPYTATPHPAGIHVFLGELSTRDEVLRARGAPRSESTTSRGCAALEYDAGLIWGGVAPLLLVVPVPLVVPIGRAGERYYLMEGEVIGRSVDETDVVGGVGYMCGSNDCEFLFGGVPRDPAMTAAAETILTKCGR